MTDRQTNRQKERNKPKENNEKYQFYEPIICSMATQNESPSLGKLLNDADILLFNRC